MKDFLKIMLIKYNNNLIYHYWIVDKIRNIAISAYFNFTKKSQCLYYTGNDFKININNNLVSFILSQSYIVQIEFYYIGYCRHLKVSNFPVFINDLENHIENIRKIRTNKHVYITTYII